jgi:NADPH:quinone reductase-like Zn-dependent oxidoreductase
LIHGASGAVGSVATQLAVARGVTVIGTAGRNRLDFVRSLGATPLRYGEELVRQVRELAPDGVQAVFDTAGQGVLPDSISLLGGPERIITIADPAAGELGVTFSGGDRSGQTPQLLTELAELVVSGRLRLTHGASFALAEAATAQELSESGHPHGKITIAVR